MADITEGNAAPVINPPPPPADGGAPGQLSPGEGQQIAATRPPAPPQQVQADMPNLPAQSAPSVKFSPKRGGLAGVLDEVRNWVAGTQGTAIAYDTQGNRYVTHPALTAHQQWAKVGATAFRGAVAGYAAGRGGNPGKALAAGAEAQVAAQDKARQEQETEADKDAAVARQNRLDAANDHVRSLQIAQLTFSLDRQKAEAGEHDMKLSQEQDQHFHDIGAVDLGIVNSSNFQELQKNDPNFIKNHVGLNASTANFVPQVDKDHNRTGVHLWSVSPQINSQAAPPGTQVNIYTPPKDPNDLSDFGSFKKETPTDMHTIGEINSMNQDAIKQSAQRADDIKKRTDALKGPSELKEAQVKAAAAPALTQAELRAKNAQADQAYASAALDRQKVSNMKAGLTEDGKPKTGLDPLDAADHEEIIKGMLDGSLNIVQTFGVRSNSPTRALYEAEAHRRDPSWNMQKFGAMQKVIQQYASTNASDAGGQIMSFNYFMGHAGDFLAQVQRLRNTNSPLLNTPMNWMQENIKGNEAIPPVLNSLQTMAQESQRFLEGKTLTDEDNKELKKKINLDMTPAQMEGVAKQMMHSGVIRLGGLNHSYRTTVGHDFDGLLDPNSAAVLNETAKGTDYDSLALRGALNTYLPRGNGQGGQGAVPVGTTRAWSGHSWQFKGGDDKDQRNWTDLGPTK